MMKPPHDDLDERSVIWFALQEFWLDTDPAIMLPSIAQTCATSKYTIAELEAIYWNEVYPAVRFNLWMLPVPEWAGFDMEWLKQRVLKKSRFGRRLPNKRFHPEAAHWWTILKTTIEQQRSDLVFVD